MLQPTEKARIRLYLGYPDLLRYKHSRLESMLTSLSDEAETLVRENLAALVTVESLLLTSTGNAGIRRVDEIWFDTGTSQLTGQRKAGRQYVSRLSILLGVPIYSDVFGGAGYLGDKFSGYERGGAGFYSVG